MIGVLIYWAGVIITFLGGLGSLIIMMRRKVSHGETLDNNFVAEFLISFLCVVLIGFSSWLGLVCYISLCIIMSGKRAK